MLFLADDLLRLSDEQNCTTENPEFTSCVCILRSTVCCHLAFIKIKIHSDSLLCLLSQWLKATLQALGAEAVTFC